MDYKLPTSWKDVSISSYRKLLAIPPDTEESKKNEMTLSALLCIPEMMISKIPAKDFPKIKEALEFINITPETVVNNIVEISGKKYGLVPDLNALTIGEVIDLEEATAHWNTEIHTMMAILFRPITHYENWDDYEIEPYNDNTVKRRAKLFDEQMSVSDAYSVSVFFSNIASLSWLHTTVSLTE